MFDISFGEVIIVGGVAILLLGKKDMPLVFRLMGRAVGKVSGLIQGGRARMTEMSKGNELMQLQNEIRSNLDDLRLIKAELRGAARLPTGITSMSHPGTQILREQARDPTDPFAGVSQQPASAVGHATVGSNPAASPTGVTSTASTLPGGGPGAGAAVGLSPSSMKSVESAGGDRLQQLAMAEVGFSEQGLYVPKTDSAPSGADVINDTIIDSLLQERFQKVISSAKNSTQHPEERDPLSST